MPGGAEGADQLNRVTSLLDKITYVSSDEIFLCSRKFAILIFFFEN